MAHGDGDEASGRAAWSAPPPSASRISDPAKLLTPAERQALDAELREVETAQGDELWILATRFPSLRLAVDAGRAVYARWRLAPQPPRATVLIVVDATSRRAAIETGQGVEGPMTSLEVEDLLAKTAALLKSGSWAAALHQIVQGVAATCAATRARRRPPQESAEVVSEGNSAAPGEGTSQASGSDPAGTTPAGKRGLFTRIVAGGAVAFLLLVALRQRKKNAERSAELAQRPAPPKYLGPPRIDR